MAAGKRPPELSKIAVRDHRTIGQAIAARPPIGQIHRAEDGVDDRQMDREVLVDGLHFVGMVPVVELRCGDQPPERAEAGTDVRVDEGGLRADDDEIGGASAKPIR
jgi:hypothetical protein